MKQLTDHTTTLDLDFSKLATQAIKNAWDHGRENSYQDVKQQYEGVQARLDQVNATRAQTDRQISADHSKVQQLNQIWHETAGFINDNDKTMRNLISQLESPIEIDGSDVLRAVEDSAGMTVNKVITKKTAEIILSAQQTVNRDKNTVFEAQKTVVKRINSFQNWLLLVLGAAMLAMIVPWVPLKLVIGMLGVIGGYLYDKIK
ncbi:hypothetical protein BSQ39_09060 [Loigolactobacillus backii]|uniref:hypothetical protein n=1 Tax=Loigolactobacillus backii TaxID=375175 RepID=UPI000C1C9C23|nr:hypothetical protein [Loigolactobacillus backii]PIO83704.1 hypothetical protein BSQ39_09060 [Loigolactobacillus backii]